MSGFITPPNHENFVAKPLFESAGEIIDGSIAYIDPNEEDLQKSIPTNTITFS